MSTEFIETQFNNFTIFAVCSTASLFKTYVWYRCSFIDRYNYCLHNKLKKKIKKFLVVNYLKH